MDDILVGQAAAGATLSGRQYLKGDEKEEVAQNQRERQGW